MKKCLQNFGFIFLAMFFMASFNQLSAQRQVIVEPGDHHVGLLNEAISGDTTATGERVDLNTVYVLRRGPAAVYLLNGSIGESFPVTIVAEDGPGERPKLVPGVAELGGESDRPFRPKADLTIKGLDVTSRDALGLQRDRMIRVSADKVTITIIDCNLHDDGQSVIRFDTDSCSAYFYNSTISNIGLTGDPSNGRIVDDRGNHMIEVIFKYNTIYNITRGAMRDDGGILRNFEFINNTVFNTGTTLFQLGEVIDAKIENNIFVNYSFYSDYIDPLTGYPGEQVNADSLSQKWLDLGYTQNIRVRNNSWNIEDAMKNMPILGDSLGFDEPFDIIIKAFMKANGDSASNMLDADIAFTNPPPAQTVLATAFWTLGQAHADIPWFDVTGEPYDFSYPSNAPQATAGTDGTPLGAPHWMYATGIKNLRSKNKINIYPNPASDFIYLQSDARIQTVNIFDITGKSVMSLNAADNLEMISITSLRKGIYLVNVKFEDGTYSSSKIIK